MNLRSLPIYDDKMVAHTYRYRDDRAEFVFLDRHGKELKRIYLYDTDRLSEGKLFCFYEDKYYYIKMNNDTENWELLSVKVF